MEITLALFLAIEVALAVVLASLDKYDPKEWVMVPYANYTIYTVRISEVEAAKQKQGRAQLLIDFYLFTKENANDPQIIDTGNETTLMKSHFNPKNPTRFLIHGWLEKNTQQESTYTVIRDQYLSVGSFNIFIVDWSRAIYSNYIMSAYNAPYVGKKIGTFIELLITKGKLKANDTYIVGFGLGAHVAGIAGKWVKFQKINTIIGLDPAKHLFTDADPSKRLTKEDALYVETIHTDAGYLGLEGPIGHASFYPNYGSHQPGCFINGEVTGCSHRRSCEYFAASISDPDHFEAVQCSSYSDIAVQKCNSTNITLHMGGEPSNYGHSYPGVYYLKIDASLNPLYSNHDAIALKPKSSLSVLKIKPGLGYVIMIK